MKESKLAEELFKATLRDDLKAVKSLLKVPGTAAIVNERPKPRRAPALIAALACQNFQAGRPDPQLAHTVLLGMLCTGSTCFEYRLGHQTDFETSEATLTHWQ